MARLTRRKRIVYESILSGHIRYDRIGPWYPGQIPVPINKGSDKKHMIAWCAFVFAKQYGRKEDVDMKKLESIVARSGSAYTLYHWALKFHEITNIKRFQKEILKCGNHHELRVFAQNVPGVNKEVLNNHALVKEIMESV